MRKCFRQSGVDLSSIVPQMFCQFSADLGFNAALFGYFSQFADRGFHVTQIILSVCLCACLSFYLSVCLSVRLSVCSLYLSISLSLSVRLSTHLSACLSLLIKV